MGINVVEALINNEIFGSSSSSSTSPVSGTIWNMISNATVNDINSLDESTIKTNDGWLITDSGTITIGNQDVVVINEDVVVWGSGGYFINFGDVTGPGADWGTIFGDITSQTDLVDKFDGKLSTNGSNTMIVDLNVGNNKITNLNDPTNDKDAVNKQYLNMMRKKYKAIASGVVAVENIWVPVNDLTIIDLPVGEYEILVSAIWWVNDANRKVELSYESSTGSVSNTVFKKETKDKFEITDHSFSFPYTHAGGVFNLSLTIYHAGSGSNELTVDFSNISIKREEY